MENKRTITEIHNYNRELTTRVAFYCRVSTSNYEQEMSLENQESHFRELAKWRPDWKIVGTYADVKSGNDTTHRSEFQRMLADCRAKKIDLIITKSISRFGRNTPDTLAVINELRMKGVYIHFETEDIYTYDGSKDFILSVLEGYAQAESEARSKNIKWGIAHGLKTGTSKFYTRKCYGYRQGPDGELVIDEQKAKIVRMIFSLYLDGYSIVGLLKELARQGIPSPTGKKTWNKRAIETILINEKYIGNALVGKTFTEEFPNNKRLPNHGERGRYLASGTHQNIVSEEQFSQVKAEMQRRSNIQTDGTGTNKRLSTHYSMKSVEKQR